MRSLPEILADHQDTDKNSFHSYGPFYESLFDPIRERVDAVLEVGVRRGGSLRAWSEYFPNANVWGIDNGSEAGFLENYEENFCIIKGDTTKPEDLIKSIKSAYIKFELGGRNDLFKGLGNFLDIIIDDGCHHPYAQAATFALLSPFLRKGGIYIVEDMEDISFAKKFVEIFGGEVVDRREVKQRHDDILVVWRK